MTLADGIVQLVVLVYCWPRPAQANINIHNIP